MLPSTGYFKKICCPFYDSGLCERPYCHFRHVKKESQSTSSDGVESGVIFQRLVSAAVQKVLQQQDTSSNPPSSPTESVAEATQVASVPVSKATYNPTPISKLNKINNVESDSEDSLEQAKKHIPVPYTPRKPTSIASKRPLETNGSAKPFIYIPPTKYTPGSSGNVQFDLYTPKGAKESDEKYLPGTEIELQEYSPREHPPAQKHKYVPSYKSSSSKKKLLEYKPKTVSSSRKTSNLTYKPTLKSLAPCFSSDDEELEVKNKKPIGEDLNGLDDLGAEFDILDQILDEEKCSKISNCETVPATLPDTKENCQTVQAILPGTKENCQTVQATLPDTKENCQTVQATLPDTKEKSKDINKKHSSKRKESEKYDKSKSRKSHSKSKSATIEKAIEKKDKNESKAKHRDKSEHKKSSRDRDREKKDEKSHRDKHKSSSSKHKNHKHSNSRRKSDERDSKQSNNKSKESKSTGKTKKHSNDSKEENHKDKTTLIDLFDVDNITNTEEEILEMSESDEEAIALECKRIFEEYVPQEKTASVEDTANDSLNPEIPGSEYIPGKKRVSRTSGKVMKVIPKAPLKPNFKDGAATTMAERLNKIKQFHVKKAQEQSNITNTQEARSINNYNVPKTSKIRIAHVPYASTLVNVKKTIAPVSNVKKEEPASSSTVVQTIKKGTQRVAHIPNEKFIDRPGVLEPLASKIPANIRSNYLNMMIDECLKMYLSAVDAYARAQHEELATSKKCSAVQIYKNSAALTVTRLRKEFQECNGVKKSGLECTSLQKIPQNILKKNSDAGSWSIENKNKRNSVHFDEFRGIKFYNNIKKWILTEEQLHENGFPRPHANGEKGRAIIYGQNKQKPPQGLIRTCCRCKKEYTIDKKGFPAVKEECIYHPNNKYKIRGESKYQCCSQDGSSDGCCVAPCHVYEYVDYENLKGFVRTLPPNTSLDDYGVYSLDCEMCYTTNGLNLTRVTVINTECKVVYESFIKPFHPIIDYNTRYSGITEENMANVKTTLLEVQASLLTMFNSKTILIGHSLDSDFKALKLIHDTVIDTSVLYPHKMGPPMKRALRNLSSEYLKKIIQNSLDGHDSSEDATVCMELIIYKLREDLKTR